MSMKNTYSHKPERAGRDSSLVRLTPCLANGTSKSCTAPVESAAHDVQEIIEETSATRITERGATRMDDQTSDVSMERRKKEGYF